MATLWMCLEAKEQREAMEFYMAFAFRKMEVPGSWLVLVILCSSHFEHIRTVIKTQIV